MVARKWQPDVELFREENVALETKVATLNAECDKINGAMLVAFEGREYTMQQMARFGEQTDRPLRQRAWEAATERRLRDHDAIEAIFDELLALRRQIAANAGLDNYRSFIWKAYKRFDYTPEQCLAFADAVAATCVPFVKELDRERRENLGLDRLKPWDTSVDPFGQAPLTPFQEDQIGQFVEKTKAIFARMSPALAEDFDGLRVRGNLDLGSRPGKQPGGYQYSLEEVREPFIFMNAAGLHRDVEVLLHEGGHAFHCLAAREEPLVFLRSAPMEFCEVASMSMELLGADHFDVFYSAADAARAKRTLMGRNYSLPSVDGDDRFFPALALHAPGPFGGGTDGVLALAARPVRRGRRLGRLRRCAGVQLAQAVAPVSRAVLLHRVWHRAAGSLAAVDEEPIGPGAGAVELPGGFGARRDAVAAGIVCGGWHRV